MLQETPKHVKLGITENEFLALLEVRRKLAEGKLKHRKEYSYARGSGFNMSCIQNKNGCGTVACIGGWMAMEMGYTEWAGAYVDDFRSEPLHYLFYPSRAGNWEAITPQRAVEAIDYFLEKGVPNW